MGGVVPCFLLLACPDGVCLPQCCLPLQASQCHPVLSSLPLSLAATMRGSTWYYKDRLGRTRGPCEVTSLRTAWAAGVIDRNTFVWGDDMEEWAPVSMVYGLKQAIAPPDGEGARACEINEGTDSRSPSSTHCVRRACSLSVQLAAAGYGLIHRVFNGLNPLRPFRGHEHQRQSLSQRQREALEDKRREGTVLRNYGNVWPALQTPSHALFLWASGGGLTRALNPQRSGMPDKFIPYETRYAPLFIPRRGVLPFGAL